MKDPLADQWPIWCRVKQDWSILAKCQLCDNYGKGNCPFTFEKMPG